MAPVIQRYDRIVLRLFLAVQDGGIFSASNLLTPIQLRRNAVRAVFLPPCALHKEILVADFAFAGIMPVM